MAKKRKAKRKSPPRMGTTELAQPVKKFEYTFYEVQTGTITTDELIDALNTLGGAGWLAYSAFSSGGFYHFLFAREVV